MNVAVVNYAYAESVRDPEELLARYTTLTSWSQALLAAGAARVRVAQRFHRDARLSRAGVDYVFIRDRAGGRLRAWTWPRLLHRLVSVWRPDVAHVNGLDVPMQTWLLRRTLARGAALLVQDHGGIAPPFDDRPDVLRLRSAIRRVAMRAPDGFLFTAREAAEPWRQANLIRSRQIVYKVLESSTRLQPLARNVARRQSGLDGEPAVLWVGRLNENKDPLTVIEGFAQGLARLPRAVLTMVYTDEALLPEIKARLVAAPELARQVRLAGYINHDRLPAFYSAADMFVLGSRREGSGYALVEACACGAVPVVTNIPSFRRITANGAFGALWNPGQASSFARALVETAERDLVTLRARAKEHFDAALSWAAVGRHALAAYKDAVGRRRIPA